MKPSTHIDFGLRGDDLQPKLITDQLGISPTSGYKPRELYFGKEKAGDTIITVQRERPSFGVWHFSTEGLVASGLLQDHADFLLNIFEPVGTRIDKLMTTCRCHIQLTLWQVGSTGFDLKSTTSIRLAKLCNRISFTFFEVSDSDEHTSCDQSS